MKSVEYACGARALRRAAEAYRHTTACWAELIVLEDGALIRRLGQGPAGSRTFEARSRCHTVPSRSVGTISLLRLGNSCAMDPSDR